MKLLVACSLLVLSSFALAQELQPPTSSQTLLVIPQPSPVASSIQPSILVDGKVLKVSIQSSPEARQMITRLYATTNAYSLHSQNAQYRRFSVQVQGACIDPSKIVVDSFGFATNDGRVECVNGAEIVVQSITPIRLRQPNDRSINDGDRAADEGAEEAPRGSTGRSAVQG